MNSTTTTQTEMIDTQARVIRSLNLVHSADTKYMVGAAELERLLIQDAEHEYQREYIKRLEREVALLRIHCNYADVMVVDAILRGEEEVTP